MLSGSRGEASVHESSRDGGLLNELWEIERLWVGVGKVLLKARAVTCDNSCCCCCCCCCCCVFTHLLVLLTAREKERGWRDGRGVCGGGMGVLVRGFVSADAVRVTRQRQLVALCRLTDI